ncbi:2,4-dihydroxyhept-2-ene-1,7-dioic acid aldolase [Mycena chlorophos]|uniref:2,4-dihydroxyhept-2-ene-1,7-dioic acid aldolase n=1 Tax=Mycena chlorophos TaxID=658473 RepID=A0A8H6STV7_MYCCL|nr:2,4-dihydroxyhept-2-ene-1,7-dioic acid aldolase [Mycena chlorophos]
MTVPKTNGHRVHDAHPRFTLDATAQAEYRGPTLQQPANTQKLFRSGKVAIGAALSYPSRHVAKTVAITGADWCWIDAEHVAWSTTQLVECIQIIIQESGGKMIPIVRVPSKTAFDYMAWALDAGAGGIIIPHVDTPEEVKAIIGACRFPPIGHRSFPPFTFIPGVTDLTPEGKSVFSIANEHVAIIPQIESRVGVKNLEEIVKMPEINAFMIGAGDLRLDMGLPMGMVGDEPEFVAAVSKATQMSQKYNIPLLGVAIGPEMLKLRIEQGFTVISVVADLHALAYTMIKGVADAKATVEDYKRREEAQNSK